MSNSLIEQNRLKDIRKKASSMYKHNLSKFDSLDFLLNLAKENNIEIYEKELDDISGALRKENDRWVIYVNRSDSKQRQLFTIAHELGHYFLHKNEKDEFIDSPFIHRDETNKYAEMEVEANEFAANLIMPEQIIDDLIDIQHYSNDEVRRLSKVFGVSLIAMEVRLKNLKP